MRWFREEALVATVSAVSRGPFHCRFRIVDCGFEARKPGPSSMTLTMCFSIRNPQSEIPNRTVHASQTALSVATHTRNPHTNVLLEVHFIFETSAIMDGTTG